jgi:hypothetical protein
VVGQPDKEEAFLLAVVPPVGEVGQEVDRLGEEFRRLRSMPRCSALRISVGFTAGPSFASS